MENAPKRKPNRLIKYDYSQNGAYFITICIKDKQNLLWNIKTYPLTTALNVGANIARPYSIIPTLSKHGIIIDTAIKEIPTRYPSVQVSKYCIMPNHIHIILTVSQQVGRTMHAPTMSTVINQLKGYVTKQVGLSLWQKSFHDHILRNEQDYQKIWRYIETNPQKWEEDCFYNK